jgi:hypothetical protein
MSIFSKKGSNMPQYEWHEISTIFINRMKRQRQVIALALLMIDNARPDGARCMPTGLAYVKLHSEPIYTLSKTGLGYYGSYYPMHLASHEQLLSACWSNEPTIRHFLQLLTSSSPEPDYWRKADRLACIEQFPGGLAAINDLETQSVQVEAQSNASKIVRIIAEHIFDEDRRLRRQTSLTQEEAALLRDAEADEGIYQRGALPYPYYWFVDAEMFYSGVKRSPARSMKQVRAARKAEARKKERHRKEA